jgi:DNA-binding transcriptional MerR regulator
MRTLKMQDAATLLSVSPSTLRNWERRFGYPVPMRSAGGHRHYAHAEIAALRGALEEGLSISSAVGRAREALAGTTPEGLTRALADLDFEAADLAMEAALALRALEPAVQDMLLVSLTDLGAQVTESGAVWALAAAWGGGWLRRAVRMCPAPWGTASVLVGDAGHEPGLDALHLRALELFAARAGAQVTTLPVTALDGLSDVLRRVRPDVVLVAGAHAPDDTVGRWTYSVQRALGRRPLARYRRRVSVATAAGDPALLADAPIDACRQLLELAGTEAASIRALGA